MDEIAPNFSNGIMVVPGMPESDDSNDSGFFYPASTMAVVKVLREQGYSVRVATDEVRELSYHAADLWLPILEIGRDLLVGAGGNLLAALIVLLIDSKQNVRAHVKWRVTAPDGTVQTFKYDGDREGAIRAAELFEASLRPDEER